MDELIANGSVAATSKKTEKMLEKAHQWSQEMTDRLASILSLQDSPEQSRTSLTLPPTNNSNNTILDTTIARRQAAAAQLQLAGLSASFYVQQGRKSLSVSIQKSPRTKNLFVFSFFSHRKSFSFLRLDTNFRRIIKTTIDRWSMKTISMTKINRWNKIRNWFEEKLRRKSNFLFCL